MTLPVVIALALISAVTARADYPGVVLADHPVGYWPLNLAVDTNTDATTGDYIAADLSGHGNYGDYISISPNNGQETNGPSEYITNAIIFDGVATYVDLSVGSNTALMNFGGTITMEAWVQTTFDTLYSLSYIQESVIAKGQDSSPETNCIEMGGDYWGNYDGGSYSVSTGIQGQMDDAQFGGNDAGGGDPVVPDSAWHHEVCTYDGTNWNFYLDGELQNATPGAAGAIDCTTPWAIGTGTAAGLANLFPGNICQVALYSNALTSGQVKAHYLTGKYGSATPLPAILTQPGSHRVYPGGSATFSLVLDVATGPFGYQWYKGASAISEQTNSALTWTDVQSTDSTNYSVVVNNASGAVTSSVVTLTVLAAPAANSYVWNVVADKPTGYWRLNETNGPTIYDAINGFDGTFVGTLETAPNSPLIDGSGVGINFDGPGLITLPYSPLLNRTNAFSYEVWYDEDPATIGIRCPLWFRDEPVLGDTRGWVHYMEDDVDTAGDRGNVFQSSDVFTTWNGLSSPTLFAQGEWQHLVCTFDGQHKQIFVDGVLVAVSTNAVLEVKPVQRAVDTISSSSYPFLGCMEEVAIYTNALSAERIQAHWIAAEGTNPPAVAATFEVPPLGVSTYIGGTITIPVVVVGTTPFNYEWWTATTNGVATAPVEGQTNSTLLFPSATTNDAGNYVLVVNNSAGSVTSSVATVSVVSSPATVISSPLSATRMEGISVTLDVVAGGSQPIYYQWLSNGVTIAGATSSSLTLADIQPSFANNYSVTVWNLLGTNTSVPATLTVIPEKPGSYAASVAADGPVGFWRLDEAPGSSNALDIAGGYNGVYSGLEVLGQPGSIPGDPATAIYVPGAGGVQIPFAAALNPPATFSVEGWAWGDTNGVGTDRVLVSSRTSYAGWYYGYQVLANANNDWQFTIGEKTSGTLSIASKGTNAADGAWHYIVATYNNNVLVMSLYVDGQLAATGNPAAGVWAPNEVDNAGAPTTPAGDQAIGSTSDNDPQGTNVDSFYGGIDDVAIYNYALTAAQITSHYTIAASPTLVINKGTGDSIVVTWSSGHLLTATNLLGPWTTNTTATPPLTNTITGSTMFFKAVAP